MGLHASGAVGDTRAYLEILAEVNRNGFGFLLAFGLTWLVAGVVWARWGDRAGAYAALFQGLVGTPLGLLLTAASATADRPDDPTMTALSIYLATGQLLVLPLAIVLVVRERYSHALSVLVTVMAVHLVPYSWLYRTPVYAAVAVAIAVLTATVVANSLRSSRSPGPRLCLGSGVCLLLGGLAALVL